MRSCNFIMFDISSTTEFDELLSSLPADKLLVVDFHAVWCGPCKFIAPVIEQMAAKYADVAFVKIDVDKQPALAKRYSVSAMPTFLLLKGGKVIDTLRGAQPKPLIAMVAKHSGRDAAKEGDEIKVDAPAMSPLARLVAFAVIAFLVVKLLKCEWSVAV